MTQATEEVRGGELVASDSSARVALRGVRLLCRVAGISARATLEQTFVNLEAKAIEAVYTFPLPDGAAVCGFEVVFFDKVFTGVLEETDKAVEKYDDAIAEGHGAYMVEQHRPDVFSVRVGNLKPRQAVTIRLTYVMDLEVVDRGIRLAFPTTVAPRYTTDNGMDPVDAVIDGEAMNPPHVLSVPYGITAEIEIELGKMLAGVTSRSHAIHVMRGTEAIRRQDELAAGGACVMMSGDSAARMNEARDRVTVTLAGGIAEMNRELVLNLELAKEREPFALSATSAEGEKFVAVAFVPEFEEEDLDRAGGGSETVFVLDCSGSMQGESTQQAVAALACCLRAMSAGDTFNICRFGSSFEMFSPEPVTYSDATFKKALAFIQREADLGGTELLPPLEAIFAIRPAGSARNVVLLTDGQVSNEPAVIALARRKRSRNRIFTFGIGAASSAFLVKGLARVTGGASEFISAGERIEDKVLRTFGRLASPPVTDVEIDWGNSDAEVTPRELPPVFDGDGLRVFARVQGKLPERVTLKCKTLGGERSWTVNVREARDAADVLPKFWARAAIQSIEDEHAQTAHSQAIASGSAEAKKMIAISKRYGVACAQTSFVAVEHRSLEDRNEGRPELRRVPLMLAAGWGGVEVMECDAGGGTGMAYACSAPAPMQAPMAAPCSPSSVSRPEARKRSGFDAAARSAGSVNAGPVKDAAAPKKAGLFGKLRKALGGALGAEKAEAAKSLESSFDRSAGFDAKMDLSEEQSVGSPSDDAGSEVSGDALVDLLALQQADGSFANLLSQAEALKRLGVDLAKVWARTVEVVLPSPNLRQDTISKPADETLVVISLMRVAFADRQAVWKRATKKATSFVMQALSVTANEVEEWIAEIVRRIQAA